MTDTNLQTMSAKPSRATSRRTRATIARHAASWGYRVTRARVARVSADFVESVLTLVGAVSVMLTAGLWLLPGTSFAAEVIGIKLGLSMLIGLGGLALLQISRRGLNRELQVDRSRRQLRLVWRNRRGETRLHTPIEFDEVGSMFVRRHPLAGRMAHLFVRIDGQSEPLELFFGAEAEMEALWKNLKVELRSAPEAKPLHRESREELSAARFGRTRALANTAAPTKRREVAHRMSL